MTGGGGGKTKSYKLVTFYRCFFAPKCLPGMGEGLMKEPIFFCVLHVLNATFFSSGNTCPQSPPLIPSTQMPYSVRLCCWSGKPWINPLGRFPTIVVKIHSQLSEINRHTLNSTAEFVYMQGWELNHLCHT